MSEDRRAYTRAYYEYARDKKAGEPSLAALERLGRAPQKRGPASTVWNERQIAAAHRRWILQRPRVSLAALAQEIGVSRQRLFQLFQRSNDGADKDSD